ncbi:MAG: NADH-quinone oxidoreductase subunit NuoE [Armatimonadota bacterium]
MLTADEIDEIEAELKINVEPRGACIAALRIVQSHRGYVSDETLRELAGVLGMTPDELEAVATFYNLIFRRPVGRRVLKVCDGVVCWMLGSESLLQHLERRLGIKAGETTTDGRFTLLPICCLGDCDHGPVMMVNDTLIRDLTPELLDRVLADESVGARGSGPLWPQTGSEA